MYLSGCPNETDKKETWTSNWKEYDWEVDHKCMLLFSRKPRSRWFWPRSVRITNHLIINEIVSIHGHSETNMELNAFHRVRITSRLTRRLFCGSCTSIALFNGDRIHLIFTCCSCDWVRSPPNFAAHLKIQREISHCIYEENSTSQPSLWFESKQRCDAYSICSENLISKLQI